MTKEEFKKQMKKIKESLKLLEEVLDPGTGNIVNADFLEDAKKIVMHRVDALTMPEEKEPLSF